MKRIVISDTHIGSKFYRANELLEFLSTTEFDQLILAGDIIDFIKIPTFTERCAEILKTISGKKEVIYIVGNHDASLDGLVGTIFSNVTFCRKYEFEAGGRTFRIEHGDRFETGFFHTATIVKIISVAQDMLERWLGIDLTTWLTGRLLKSHKLRAVTSIMKDNDDVDVFIMGHTHIPEVLIWIHADQSVKTYVNTGDWVSHQTYVSIDDGKVRLKEYEFTVGTHKL